MGDEGGTGARSCMGYCARVMVLVTYSDGKVMIVVT